MANHLGRFLPHLSEVTAPIRALLQKSSAWVWDVSQQNAFQKLKHLLSSDACMARYDPSYHTTVSADASSYGLGAVLLQQQPTGEQRAIAFASRSLTVTETRYSQTEKEALAVTWAVERFDQFVRGIEFDVQTDHRPLVTLLGSAELDLIPPRIQRLRMRLLRYQYKVLYVPGKLLATADTLSRAPDTQRYDNCHVGTLDVELFASDIVKRWEEHTFSNLEHLRQHQAADGTCCGLVRLCERGWPARASQVPVHLRVYWKERSSITFCEGLLLYNKRILVPAALRKDMLERIHEGHQGIGRCKARARDSVWWPTINSDIEQLVTGCERCAQTRIQHSEPLIGTPTPRRPWLQLGVDLFELAGRHYILIVDYYSRFPEVVSLTSTSSTAVIAAMKSVFARFGIPTVVISDNGPQFSSRDFTSFATEYGFHHVTSSPRYPQANGEAERMVRTMKEMFAKTGDPYLALLNYRDTPGASGYSPSQLLMGRRLQTRVPKVEDALQPQWPSTVRFRCKDARERRRQARNFNRRHAARLLRPLSPGDDVWVRDMACAAQVLRQARRPRSYVVETERGIVERNRRHLVPFTRAEARAPDPLMPILSSASGGSHLGTTPQQDCSRAPSTGDLHATPASPQERPAEILASPIVPVSPSSRGQVTRSGRRVKPPDRLNL